MPRIILIGPPGAGKGTQGKRLARDLQIPTVAMGDILRDKKNENSELGRSLKQIMADGRYVPDDVVIEIMRERIQAADCRDGFILDGFPRTVGQADALERMLESMNLSLTAVVNLQVPHESIIERLSGRRIAPKSGQEYHVKFKAPKQAGICDVSGEALVQRDDDKEETIRKRLEVFEEQTKPLIGYYARKGLLRNINGADSFDAVFAAIKAAVVEKSK